MVWDIKNQELTKIDATTFNSAYTGLMRKVIL
jgi:hypothetical protein